MLQVSDGSAKPYRLSKLHLEGNLPPPVALLDQQGQPADQTPPDDPAHRAGHQAQGRLVEHAGCGPTQDIFVKGLPVLKLVLEEQVHGAGHDVVHEPGSSEGVPEATGLLADRVEEVVHDELARHAEVLGHALAHPLAQTEDEPEEVGSPHREGHLVPEVAVLEYLHCLLSLLTHNYHTRPHLKINPTHDLIAYLLMQSTANRLTLRLVFFTAKSRRQTTPNLVQNPRLTERGLLAKKPHSYRHEITPQTADSHLYWNPTVQNKLRRQDYNHHKLYKLGIRSIHDAEGNPLNNRPKEEVLWELSNLRLIKQSLGRTLINLREIVERFPEVMSSQDREMVVWAVEQVQSRFLASMRTYNFSTYLNLRERLDIGASQALVVHMYKWIEGEVEQPTGKYKPKHLLKNLRYVFRSPSAKSDELQDILLPKQIEFKLFEDTEPANKPLLHLLPRLFSSEQIQQLKNDPSYDIKKYQFLNHIPGGSRLLDRFEAA